MDSSLEEKIKIVNSKLFSGEVYFKDGELIWRDDDDSEEAEDNLYTSYCEASNTVREVIPNCEIIDIWQDNDSAGFTIKLLN